MDSPARNADSIAAATHGSRGYYWLRQFFWLLGIGLFVFLAVSNFETIRTSPHQSVESLAAIGGLFVVARLLSSVSFYLAISTVQPRVSWRAALAVNIFSNLAAFLLPMMGLVTRITLLNRRFAIKPLETGAVMACLSILNLAAIAFVGLLAALVVAVRYSEPVAWGLAGIFAAFLLLAICLFQSRLPKSLADLINRRAMLGPARAAWRQLSANQSILARILLLQCAAIGSRAARLAICFHFIGSSLAPGKVVLIAQTGDLSAVTGIFPGGIGLQELFIGGASLALTQSAVAGISAAVLDRLITVSLLIPLGVLALVYLLLGGYLKRSIGSS